MSQAPPKELQRQLTRDPRLWIRNYLRHPEDPTRAYDFYDASGDEFLWYLVDDEGPLNPEQWGDINVLLFARGCLKTFTCTSIMSWGTDMYPTLEFDATAPVDDQRYEVIDRFKEKAEEAGMVSRRAKDKLSHQKFKNVTVDPSSGDKYTSYSHVKSRSAWGDGDKLRGLHGHGGVIDEAQDVDEATFTTFATEAVDREVPDVDFFPTVFVIGTPKLSQSFFHKLWKMSDQKTWDADERTWVQESDPEDFSAGEGDGGFTVRGWHIDQYNSPLHEDARIQFKKQTYSKKKFKNEVLAEFYTPENDLLSNDEVWAALDAGNEMGWRESRLGDDSRVFVGVDWGGGDSDGAAKTVIVVGEKYQDGHIEIRKVDVLDETLSKPQEAERVHETIEQYQADLTVVDEGWGDYGRAELQDEYGHAANDLNPLVGCWFGSVKNKDDVVWNEDDSGRKKFFTANKSYVVNQFVEDFKSGNTVIPKKDLSFESRYDLGSKIIDQLTAPYTDRVETGDGKKKLRVESDRQDDIFDAFLYMWIAAKHLGDEREVRRFGSHMQPGY